MAIRAFTLPPWAAYRAFEAGGPLAEADPTKLTDMKDLSIAVVEVDDRIVAYWVVFKALHVEPLWIHPDHRKSPAVVGRIVKQMQEIVEATQEPAAFCVIEDTPTASLVASYADRLGFHIAPGSLYYLVVQPAQEPVGG